MNKIIDLIQDELKPVGQLTKDRLGRRVSPATGWRWRTKGVRGVKLPMVLDFGQWCSTEAALTEFLRASSEAGMPAADPPAERDEATTQRLRKAGLL